jgi:crotonobetaine/carnitine-CoA ligase
LEYIVCWIGLSWLKAIEVGVHTDLKGDALLHTLRDSQPAAVLVHASYLERLLDIWEQVTEPPVVIVIGEHRGNGSVRSMTIDEFFDGVDVMDPPPPPNFWDTGCICYTSGTTGPSKGVVVPWGQLREMMGELSRSRLLGPDDALYSTIPLFHIGGKAYPLLVASYGGTMVFRESFSASQFLDDVRRNNCTWTVLIGAMAPLLFKQQPLPSDAENPLWLIQNAPVFPEMAAFKTRFGIKRVITQFGMTEVCPPFVNLDVGDTDIAACGKAVPGVQVRIVDEHDYPVSPEEVGELIVRSEEPWCMNLGYYNRPEATATAWQNGWFHTGDAFRVDRQRNYYWVDRMSDAVRRRGENVSSLEVELLVNQHPGVDTSACIAVPSELGEHEIKICVQRRPGSTLSEETLVRFLIETMPRFMVPRYIEFVAVIPKTPTQRIQKSHFRENPITERTWDREAAGIQVPK